MNGMENSSTYNQRRVFNIIIIGGKRISKCLVSNRFHYTKGSERFVVFFYSIISDCDLQRILAKYLSHIVIKFNNGTFLI